MLNISHPHATATAPAPHQWEEVAVTGSIPVSRCDQVLLPVSSKQLLMYGGVPVGDYLLGHDVPHAAQAAQKMATAKKTVGLFALTKKEKEKERARRKRNAGQPVPIVPMRFKDMRPDLHVLHFRDRTLTPQQREQQQLQQLHELEVRKE